MERLARETALREGEPPAALQSPLLETPILSISSDAFLLALPNGLRFHYQRGESVVFSRPNGVSDAEVTLFHSGSVYGAVAWLNGLVPLHASAVVHNGQVHAFTGASGAGKSTLSAALVERGLPLFADDVLVLDLSDPEQPMALPGHKRLKLKPDALEMTSLQAGERVRDDIEKFYVDPPLLKQDCPLPLRALYLLREANSADASLHSLGGVESFAQVRGAFYRPLFCDAVLRPVEIFTAVERIRSRIALQIFDRSQETARFAANVDFLADAIRADHG